jgi:hypothetical protein
MKNRELSAEFKDCLPNSKVLIINPGIDGTDFERLGIGRVTYLNGSDPLDSIIEASRGADSSIRGDELVRGISMNGPDGRAQVFVPGWEGQPYAYFEINEVRRGPYHHSIILGDCIAV